MKNILISFVLDQKCVMERCSKSFYLCELPLYLYNNIKASMNLYSVFLF